MLPATPAAAQTFARADSLLARGDTSGAIAVYEAMVDDDLRNAEAHYRAGMLYMTRHEPGTDLSPNRRAAEEHFRYATSFQGDSAKYWLALAELFRGEDWAMTRAQVSGLLEKAREAALRTGARDQMAPVAYRAARAEWEQYIQRGRRVLFNDFSGVFNEDRFTRDNDYARDFIERGARMDLGAGEAHRVNAEELLREALRADPGYLPAAGLFVVLMSETRRWEEAIEIARRTLDSDSANGRAWALLGLVLARQHRWGEAAAAHDSAFMRMSPDERIPYDNLGLILREADRVTWEQAGARDQEEFHALYWNVADPLLITEGNESRIEFLSRITYAEHRWSDPPRGYRGWETDIGAVYVRYGPPDVWWTLGRGGGGGMSPSASTPILWLYAPSGLRFVFTRNAGFARSRFSGDSKESYRVAVAQRPSQFNNVPVIRTMDTVAVQTAQFRGEDRTDVAIFGFIPIGRMLEETQISEVTVASGAIVQTGSGAEVERVRREETLRTGPRDLPEVRTWRLALPPRAGYLLRVEAHVPQIDRAARNVRPLDVRRFGRRTLQLSDILLATRVAPRDSNARRWSDFFIEPSAGRFVPDETVSLLWEVYNLTPDSGGVARYTVEVRVTVDEIERQGFFARVVGGVADAAGLTARGDDAVTILYERAEAVEPNGTLVEYLEIELGDAPRGLYTVEIGVHDRITDRVTRVSRRFVVTEELLPGPGERDEWQ